MKINLKKDNFVQIENAFMVLQETRTSKSALDIIEKAIESSFGIDVTVVLVFPMHDNESLFVMSVFPEMSTVDKIILDVMNNQKNSDTIKKLWEQNKKWTIEIDASILEKEVIDLSPAELTAVLLHEIGHTVCSNSITTRISTILRYEIAKTSLDNKMLLRNGIMRKIMSLPILDACIGDNKTTADSIRDEIKADNFVKKMGYRESLLSALKKLTSNKRYVSQSIDKKMKDVSQFALENLDQYKARETNLSKKTLLGIRESCCSPYIESVLNEIITTLYEAEGNCITEESKIDSIHDMMEHTIEDQCMLEFSLFGKKELKPIDSNELDYIEIKSRNLKTENDKIMLVSYLHSKLDMVDYYISILNDKKLSKKYYIPHSLDQLNDMRKNLLVTRDRIISTKLPERNKNILVSWPTGYEG